MQISLSSWPDSFAWQLGSKRSKRSQAPVHKHALSLCSSCFLLSPWPTQVTWLSPDSAAREKTPFDRKSCKMMWPSKDTYYIFFLLSCRTKDILIQAQMDDSHLLTNSGPCHPLSLGSSSRQLNLHLPRCVSAKGVCVLPSTPLQTRMLKV